MAPLHPRYYLHVARDPFRTGIQTCLGSNLHFSGPVLLRWDLDQLTKPIVFPSFPGNLRSYGCTVDPKSVNDKQNPL